MTTILFNPGTESRPEATAENAVTIAARITEDLQLPARSWHRAAEHDQDGWFRFVFSNEHGSVEVYIPGDDPDEVCLGKPFTSRRLYVDGTSWLYGYALGFISTPLGLDS